MPLDKTNKHITIMRDLIGTGLTEYDKNMTKYDKNMTSAAL